MKLYCLFFWFFSVSFLLVALASLIPPCRSAQGANISLCSRYRCFIRQLQTSGRYRLRREIIDTWSVPGKYQPKDPLTRHLKRVKRTTIQTTKGGGHRFFPQDQGPVAQYFGNGNHPDLQQRMMSAEEFKISQHASTNAFSLLNTASGRSELF